MKSKALTISLMIGFTIGADACQPPAPFDFLSIDANQDGREDVRYERAIVTNSNGSRQVSNVGYFCFSLDGAVILRGSQPTLDFAWSQPEPCG